jgi:branched-subunit amino acid aminotransferase/4-amino-4-deoxychorismate lyase
VKKEAFPSFFESIRVADHSIALWPLHYERISQLISDFAPTNQFLSIDHLEKLILDKTQLIDSSEVKVKLTLKIENNSIVLDKMECTPIEPEEFNSEIPVRLTIYQEGVKDSRSPYSNYKADSALLYRDSLIYAQSLGCDQSIILNERNEIVETSICNIFFRKDGLIYTPPLSSGCVNGVLRRAIMHEQDVHEKIIPLDALANFDSIFLTNAVRGQLQAFVF